MGLGSATCSCDIIVVSSEQTRDIEPMLGQCWIDVLDGGPTLTQHWFNVVFCLQAVIIVKNSVRVGNYI